MFSWTSLIFAMLRLFDHLILLIFFVCTSQRAVTTALWCNFLVFSLKFGVWLATSSHVMLAEVVHSVADFANQVSGF